MGFFFKVLKMKQKIDNNPNDANINSQFKQQLILKKGIKIKPGIDEYGMELIKFNEPKTIFKQWKSNRSNGRLSKWK